MKKLLIMAFSIFIIAILIFYVYSINTGANVNNFKMPRCYATTKGLMCIYGGIDEEDEKEN